MHTVVFTTLFMSWLLNTVSQRSTSDVVTRL